MCRLHTEGIAVAPSAFGPLGGQIIVGVEGNDDSDPQSGKVYAVEVNRAPTLVADIGFCAENIAFVPTSGGTFYHAQLSFERERENKLLTCTASQFLARAGRMLVTNEMSGDLWEVAWDGARYTQSLAGRAPERWPSEGLDVEWTELEQAVFAVRAPSLPSWTDLGRSARRPHHRRRTQRLCRLLGQPAPVRQRHQRPAHLHAEHVWGQRDGD